MSKENTTTISPYDFKRLQLKAYGYDSLLQLKQIQDQVQHIEKEINLVQTRLKEVDELEKQQSSDSKEYIKNNIRETKQDVIVFKNKDENKDEDEKSLQKKSENVTKKEKVGVQTKMAKKKN